MSADIQTPNQERQKTRSNINAPISTSGWNLIKSARALRFLEDDEHNLLAIVAVVTDPNQGALAPVGMESSTNPNLRMSIWNGATEAAVINVGGQGDGGAFATNGFVVDTFGYRFNGSTWDRQKTGTTKAVPASGASPLTIFAAAGAGLKRRVFDITLSSSAAGVVVLSDGLGSIRAAAGGANSIHYGPDGILQDTANTAITATLAAATLEAIGIGNAGE